MAERGDVLRLKRRLGFGNERSGERVAVVQASPLNSSLPTTIVVPLHADTRSAPASLSVRVSAKEAGAEEDQVAVAAQIQMTLLDRLAPGRVGRLHPRTLALLDQKLRLVLDL
jgi:mRNA-degrading endonuclease toxin of MazEF toxin-antitoxin module